MFRLSMIVLVLQKEVERSISEKFKEAFKEEACNLILFLSIFEQKGKKGARLSKVEKWSEEEVKLFLIDVKSESRYIVVMKKRALK